MANKLEEHPEQSCFLQKDAQHSSSDQAAGGDKDMTIQCEGACTSK
jgi:hypothetical protein